MVMKIEEEDIVKCDDDHDTYVTDNHTNYEITHNIP